MITEQLDLWIKILLIAALNIYVFVTCMEIIKRFNEISIVGKVRQAMQNRAVDKVQEAYAQNEVAQRAPFEMPTVNFSWWWVAGGTLLSAVLFIVVYITLIYDASGGR